MDDSWRVTALAAPNSATSPTSPTLLLRLPASSPPRHPTFFLFLSPTRSEATIAHTAVFPFPGTDRAEGERVVSVTIDGVVRVFFIRGHDPANRTGLLMAAPMQSMCHPDAVLTSLGGQSGIFGPADSER
ncbi:hypothetical protein B0H17DRAFT_1210804 [Mycena rosella]|uniref:Uncharacterized protein n=1 Tax=Mycena rosella TaxID=1033263 RepID=A0AAD7G8F8_MYCRO|nr:hypothetical protein B0H17DRAFT_1210804 [Mycena rosella]